MRAGALDRTITLQRFTETVNEYGSITKTWTPLVTLRAQILQASVEEFYRSFGESPETAIVFRTRYADDIETTDRVVYEGSAYNIRELKELGRRRGLEIRCVAVGSGDQD